MPRRHSLLELPEIRDSRGILTYAQEEKLPFTIKRLFVLYGLEQGVERGGHAHKAQHQLLVMMKGSVLITVDNGKARIPVSLERPSQALHVPPMLWLDLTDFSSGAVCAVLASDVYDESDYIRDRAAFLKLAAG